MINYADKYPLGSWVWRENREFVLLELAELVTYDLTDWDRDAIDAGIGNTDSETPLFYEYSFAGKDRLDFAIANESGTDTIIVLVNCSPKYTESVKSILNIATKYKVSVRS